MVDSYIDDIIMHWNNTLSLIMPANNCKQAYMVFDYKCCSRINKAIQLMAFTFNCHVNNNLNN